jgi:hypothetical protein
MKKTAYTLAEKKKNTTYEISYLGESSFTTRVVVDGIEKNVRSHNRFHFPRTAPRLVRWRLFTKYLCVTRRSDTILFWDLFFFLFVLLASLVNQIFPGSTVNVFILSILLGVFAWILFDINRTCRRLTEEEE